MNTRPSDEAAANSLPDDGQMLHDQLFRYAEDLQQMMDRNQELEQNFQQLNEQIAQSKLQNAPLESRISSMVLKNAAEGVMITDRNGIILAVNPAFSQITGFCEADAIGQTPRMLNSGSQDAAFYQNFWHSLQENGSWQGELLNKRKNGEIYLQRLTISSIRDHEGQIQNFVALLFDQSQTEKNLTYLAYHDTLTGLPNRQLLQDRIGQRLNQSKRSNEKFTLIFIDLDNFKQINDTLGHAIGDCVLCEAANRLLASVREADTVARLGGDEFVILATSLAGSDDICLFCSKAISALAQPMQISGHELFIGGSFGCAEYPQDGEDKETLMRHADQAMYQAKAAGGNTFVIYHALSELP
ncbi:MAG: sensor domain-containing diguanylate cyclase [Nitrosomonadales bacterium]